MWPWLYWYIKVLWMVSGSFVHGVPLPRNKTVVWYLIRSFLCPLCTSRTCLMLLYLCLYVLVVHDDCFILSFHDWRYSSILSFFFLSYLIYTIRCWRWYWRRIEHNMLIWVVILVLGTFSTMVFHEGVNSLIFLEFGIVRNTVWSSMMFGC